VCEFVLLGLALDPLVLVLLAEVHYVDAEVGVIVVLEDGLDALEVGELVDHLEELLLVQGLGMVVVHAPEGRLDVGVDE